MTTETVTTGTVTRSGDSLLRTAVRLDATGVGVIGLGTAAFAGTFALLTGLTPAWSYGIAGAFVVYGIVGNWLAGRPNIRPIGHGLSLFNFIGAVGQRSPSSRRESSR
jgi:hypothetical protein